MVMIMMVHNGTVNFFSPNMTMMVQKFDTTIILHVYVNLLWGFKSDAGLLGLSGYI